MKEQHSAAIEFAGFAEVLDTDSAAPYPESDHHEEPRLLPQAHTSEAERSATAGVGVAAALIGLVLGVVILTSFFGNDDERPREPHTFATPVERPNPIPPRQGPPTETQSAAQGARSDHRAPPEVESGSHADEATRLTGLHVKPPPNGSDDITNLPEIRYCFFEHAILQEARKLLDTSELLSHYNTDVADYDRRCVNRLFHESLTTQVKAELVRLEQELRDAALARVAAWSSELTHEFSSPGAHAHPQSPYGERNPQSVLVATVQQRLKALGYDPGPVDGAYGPRTRAALTEFRQDYGHPQDPTPSSKTLEQLLDALRGKESISARPHGPALDGSRVSYGGPECVLKPVMTDADYSKCGVRQRSEPGSATPTSLTDEAKARKRLLELGYYERDSLTGAPYLTRGSIERFQRNRGLPTTGRIDFNTKRALRLK